MWWLYPIVGAAAGALPGILKEDGDQAVIGAIAGATSGLFVNALVGDDGAEKKPAMDSLAAALSAAARRPELGAADPGKPLPTFVTVYCYEPPGPKPGPQEYRYRQRSGTALIQIGDMVWAVSGLDEKQSAGVAKIVQQIENRRKQGQQGVTSAMAGRLTKALEGGSAVLLGDVAEFQQSPPVPRFNEKKRKKAESDYHKRIRLQKRGMRLIEEHKKLKKKAAAAKPRKRSSA